MNCEQIEKNLQAFGEGRLDAEDSRAVRVHLASCPACASRLSPVERMEILPALDDEIEPSEDFAARFHSRLQERRNRATSVRQSIPLWKMVLVWGRPWNLTAIGTLAAILIAGALWVRYPGGTRELPADMNELSIAEHLPMLEDMAVISNLDLLENFDAIENLAPGPEGVKIQRSNP